MTPFERRALEAIRHAYIPVATPLTLAAITAVPVAQARAALESLRDADLIDWYSGSGRLSGTGLSDAGWRLTDLGRRALGAK